MRVMGIDPGSRHVHWVVFESEPARINDTHMGCVMTDSNRFLLPGPLERAAPGADVDFIAIEDFTFYATMTGRPGFNTNRNIGRIVAECYLAGIPFTMVTRQSVKGHFGVGKCRKGQVEPALRERVGWVVPAIKDYRPSKFNKDYVAALAVAITAVDKFKELIWQR